MHPISAQLRVLGTISEPEEGATLFFWMPAHQTCWRCWETPAVLLRSSAPDCTSAPGVRITFHVCHCWLGVSGFASTSQISAGSVVELCGVSLQQGFPFVPRKMKTQQVII